LKKIAKVNDNLNPESRASIYKFPVGILLIGSSRGGKTYSLYKQLSNPAYKILERIASGNDVYLVSPTFRLDDSMKKIIDLLKTEKNFDPETNAFDDVY
jgi:hypothetical protein